MPPDVTNDELAALLAALRREYTAELEVRIEAVIAAARASLASPSDRALADRALNEAHKVRGTSGSYGLMELSRAAGALEDLLARALSSPSVDDAALQREVDAAVEALRAATKLSLEAVAAAR